MKNKWLDKDKQVFSLLPVTSVSQIIYIDYTQDTQILSYIWKRDTNIKLIREIITI